MTGNTTLWDCIDIFNLSAKLTVSAVIQDDLARSWLKCALENLKEIDATIKELEALTAAKCGNPAAVEIPTLGLCHGCSNLDGAPDGFICTVYGRAVEESIKKVVFSNALDRVKINPPFKSSGSYQRGPCL